MSAENSHWQPEFLKQHSKFDGKSVTSDVRNVVCCLGVFYFLWKNSCNAFIRGFTSLQPKKKGENLNIW